MALYLPIYPKHDNLLAIASLVGFGMQASLTLILILYFGILLLIAPISLLSFDSYYYWEWSRHLALSYFDGSPMIAYFIKLATVLFGDTLFALNIVGIIAAAVTSGILYKTGRWFLSKEASLVVVALWLFSPLVTLDIVRQTTYDTPLTLFWTLTLYYTIKYIRLQNIASLYCIGVSIGLMLLSKYSGVVLVLALLVFLLTSQYRYLLKSVHLYVSFIIALLIFSPVIIWNYQHDWQSFAYQLSTHALGNAENPWIATLHSLFTTFLPALNVLLLPPILCAIFQRKHASQRDLAYLNAAQTIRLCQIVCFVFLGFYIVTASEASLRAYWLTPYLLTSALLAGYCFERLRFRKSWFILIVIYSIISLGILINGSFPLGLSSPKNFMYYRLIHELNKTYPDRPQTILTAGWLEARMLFFLEGKPNIYTLNCGSQQNQYAAWSKKTIQRIQHKAIQKAWYIDPIDRKECVEKYFDACQKLPMPTHQYLQEKYTLHVYKCTNNSAKIRPQPSDRRTKQP